MSNKGLPSAMLVSVVWLTAGASLAVAQSQPLAPPSAGAVGTRPGGAPAPPSDGAPSDLPGAGGGDNTTQQGSPTGRGARPAAGGDPAATRPQSAQDAAGPGGMRYGRAAGEAGGMSRGRGGMVQDDGGMSHGGARPDAGGNNLPSYQYPGGGRGSSSRGLPGPGGSRSW